MRYRARRLSTLFCAMSVVSMMSIIATMQTLSGKAIAEVQPTTAQSAESEAYKATSHRRFDNVEYWRSVFDDPERDEWQRPDAIGIALAIREGDVVADLGAGTGYMLSRLSRAVGSSGTVFAVEIESNLIQHIRERAEKAVLDNVTPVLCSADDPRLPAGSVDLVLILDTYHHLDRRDEYLEKLKAALADDGRVAIVDWKKKELPVGPPIPHKLARQQVLDEMISAGFHLVEEPTVLENQYFLIFKRDT